MGWLTAEQALAALGTKPQSLYANVSRGRINARPDPADPRRSLYRAEDVERLAERHRGRRKTEMVAAQTIAWGDPVLPTAVSTIVDGRLFYRGRDAVALSESVGLEAIADLLWEAEGIHFTGAAPSKVDEPMAAALAVLGNAVASDLPSLGRSPGVLRIEAARIVGLLAAAMAGGSTDAPMHERLAAAWKRPEAGDVIRRALVLMAEHELNASTFAARVAASTGAALSATVLSGMATLGGPRHGGAAAAMRDLAGLAERLGATGAVRQYLAQGRPLPCFGHRLYPDGDIRAAALTSVFALPEPFAELARVGEAAVGEKPNIDFALAAMAAAYDLPMHAPLTLFALGRSVGWLAHALEQIASGALIRPRANYVGPAVA